MNHLGLMKIMKIIFLILLIFYQKDTVGENYHLPYENNERWTRKMQGNIGVQTDADAIIKYESSLKNVDLLVFNELEKLFMQIF